MGQFEISAQYMHYNFVRIRQTLRVTPAMEAGVTTRLWSLYDVVFLSDHRQQQLAA